MPKRYTKCLDYLFRLMPKLNYPHFLSPKLKLERLVLGTMIATKSVAVTPLVGGFSAGTFVLHGFFCLTIY